MTDAFPRNRSTVRILDAGAGRGSTASYLRSLGYNNIDALTVSKERLDRAERSGLYRNFLFTALKAESTLYATGAFDAVICADGVFPDEVDPDAMDEMLRLVKPGSVFDVDVFLRCFDWKSLDSLLGWLFSFSQKYKFNHNSRHQFWLKDVRAKIL